MNKAQKIVLGFFIISAIIIAVLLLISLKDNQVPTPIDDSAINLYSREDCPHCKVVKEFISVNEVISQISINFKDVILNKTYADELREAARVCNLNPNQIGVPFLYYNKTCYIGDTPIIAFLENKLNETKI